MEQVFTSDEFQQRFGIHDIKHIKIPLYAPWHGATWERLIRTVKDCLKKTISRSKLDYFRLVTVLSDIQHAVNCRPLTYRCADNFGLEILTPNRFLKPHVETNLLLRDPKELFPPSSMRKTLAKSLELREKLLSDFKQLWYDEYLLSLKDSYKYLFESNFVNKIRVGDILLVKNPAKNRQHWCLGRVLALYPGKDGKVRSVKLVRGDADYLKGSGGLKPELHSLQHLYPLELSITHPHTTALPDTPDVDSLIEKEVEPDLDFSHDPATPLDMSNIEEMSDLVDNTSKGEEVEEDCPTIH